MGWKKNAKFPRACAFREKPRASAPVRFVSDSNLRVRFSIRCELWTVCPTHSRARVFSSNARPLSNPSDVNPTRGNERAAAEPCPRASSSPGAPARTTQGTQICIKAPERRLYTGDARALRSRESRCFRDLNKDTEQSLHPCDSQTGDETETLCIRHSRRLRETEVLHRTTRGRSRLTGKTRGTLHRGQIGDWKRTVDARVLGECEKGWSLNF